MAPRSHPAAWRRSYLAWQRAWPRVARTAGYLTIFYYLAETAWGEHPDGNLLMAASLLVVAGAAKRSDD